MDMRGIEVTNQLRSAIRAKLMELGVRYDEELPDYILVMVVNKKSRQQMHDDLNLFLEDCTTVFVDWLHDQVLKKLQKVTVAKKKSREFVPTIVVKQEEERKKRKILATSFLEDQVVEQEKQSPEKSSGKTAKDDSKLEQSYKSAEKSTKNVCTKSKTDEVPTDVVSHQEPVSIPKKPQSIVRDESATVKEIVTPESPAAKIVDPQRDQRVTGGNEAPAKSLKRLLETPSSSHDGADKKEQEAKRPRSSEDDKEDSVSPDAARKLKSCVNKPKITSVVSVKNRLGLVSPRKKFEIYREKSAAEGNGRYRQADKRFDKHRYGDNSRGGFQRNRSFEGDERSRRSREGGTGSAGSDSRHHEMSKVNDVRNKIESGKNEKLGRNAQELRERVSAGSKSADIVKKTACTIKDRLGVAGANNKPVKPQEAAEWSKNSKSTAEQPRQDGPSVAKNIKYRLGPLRNNFRPLRKAGGRQSRGSKDDDCLNLGAEEEQEEVDNDDQSAVNTGPVKSHIVAVNRPIIGKPDRKRLKETSFNVIQHSSGYSGHGAKSQTDKTDRGGTSSDADEDVDDTRLSSKVIVTPRPLKPLQPTQKRATQSLLLRAVAEANQSVVTQKNPEPSLLDKKSVLKRLKPASTRDVSQNLSVHLNSTKRLVMEKIQIELNTSDNHDAKDAEPEPYVPQAVMDEHMGVVMSLFQRSDDNQKFLVTLNGYNNNLMKEKLGSEDDEERLEMEVNEDDELALLTTHNETSYVPTQSELESDALRITDVGTDDDGDSPKETSDENNENCNTENVDKTEEMPRKRRKLSPIVYNRSHSPSPSRLKPSTLATLPAKFTEKKPSAESAPPAALDKSRENCRYWPNCTLGNKCAYLHPSVMCSAFPACKFGDKCAYKHPKCKFGLSCTKLGCVFSHPAQQCKYHPFCTKPACPYSHPVAAPHAPPLATEVVSQRAKFTWRRRD